MLTKVRGSGMASKLLQQAESNMAIVNNTHNKMLAVQEIGFDGWMPEQKKFFIDAEQSIRTIMVTLGSMIDNLTKLEIEETEEG